MPSIDGARLNSAEKAGNSPGSGRWRRSSPQAGSGPPHHRVHHPGHQDSARAHRQRRLLPFPRLRRCPRRSRNHTQAQQALPAPNQRKSRALQPHPPRGMGLRQGLQLSGRTASLLPGLRRVLQSAQAPHRTQRRLTHQPCHQPTGLVQLDVPTNHDSRFTAVMPSAARHPAGRPDMPEKP